MRCSLKIHKVEGGRPRCKPKKTLREVAESCWSRQHNKEKKRLKSNHDDRQRVGECYSQNCCIVKLWLRATSMENRWGLVLLFSRYASRETYRHAVIAVFCTTTDGEVIVEVLYVLYLYEWVKMDCTTMCCCQVVDELLAHGADPNQALTHGLNNALCVASSPLAETNRSPPTRTALVCTLTSRCFICCVHM